MIFTCPPLPEWDLPWPLAIVCCFAIDNPAIPVTWTAFSSPARAIKAPKKPSLSGVGYQLSPEWGPFGVGTHFGLREAIPNALRIEGYPLFAFEPRTLTANWNLKSHCWRDQLGNCSVNSNPCIFRDRKFQGRKLWDLKIPGNPYFSDIFCFRYFLSRSRNCVLWNLLVTTGTRIKTQKSTSGN